MHVSTHSTNLSFTVPVTSNTQRQIQPVLECRNQSQQPTGQNIADCDTEDEVNIYFNQQQQKQIRHF